MKKGCFAVFLLVLLLFGGALIGGIFLAPSLLAETTNDERVVLIIEEGDSLHRVSEILKDEGVIRSARWFRREGQAAGVDRNIRPGEYEIMPGSQFEDIFALIQTGQQREQVRITFPEGYTLYQMGGRLEEHGIASQEAFLEATNAYFQDQDFSFDTAPLYFPMEGYLFPDTYFFETDTTASQVVSVMARQMEKVLEDYKDLAKENNLTIHELLTIASLIEKEAFGDHERDTIAGVIYNRLEIDMLLQFCSSVLYGLDDGQELATRLLYRDLEVMHPFNTYQYKGLPPGPIANPGRASIQAALNPESHDYLYFVVGNGGHNFSRDYQDHTQNVEAYRSQRTLEQ
ncbi:UPF0755 protein [Tindallia magadiensis]|uniref:Endolytic murein transglycosylase n=1 Tax=Tindallia magadiensis TaxID=69895 RepID=A0A1I3ES32_9FIRM|nr:endolytic transglycosylase MltG [Tindallia magadiensis]SFI01451.1 UPF0755 protein [Tindallia magadiensis]